MKCITVVSTPSPSNAFPMGSDLSPEDNGRTTAESFDQVNQQAGKNQSMKTLIMKHSNPPTTGSLRAQAPLAFAMSRQIVMGLVLVVACLGSPGTLRAAGPAPVNLGTTAQFAILAGAGITTTGGGIINGNVGASPIAGSAIGVTCAQVHGIIYAVDASGPACALVRPALLTKAKGDLTIAYNDAAGRTPIPSGPNLNPGLTPGAGNIGGMNLAPGLYKFTTTALITGSDVTLTGGPNDVWIFQCAQDLQLGSGIKVILAGGAQAANIFWQVGTSAVLGTFSVFNGTIIADQSITMNTSSTMNGRALAFSAGVTFNGNGAAVPSTTGPGIAVQQPFGTNLVNGAVTNNFGSVAVGTNTSLTFTITNTGAANLTGLGIIIDGTNAAMFSVTTNPVAPVSPGSTTTFTVCFTPASPGLKTATLHIANNDSNNNPFNIAITGTGTGSIGTGPGIAVQQPLGTNLVNGVSTNNFGPVAIGTNTSITFTITNTGTANLTGLGITIDGTNAALFSVTTSPVAPLSPSNSTTFTVRFMPVSGGLKTAALHIASNDTNNNPFTIAITGTGTGFIGTGPGIAVQQPLGTNLVNGVSTNYFGLVAVGTNTSLTFTITNIGTANLTGLGITIDGTSAAMFSVTTNPAAPLSANNSTTFTVRFMPASPGLKTAALHIASNDTNNNPFNIAIAGTGTGFISTGPGIAVQQPLGTNLVNGSGSQDFGSVAIGTNASLTFTITNIGTANLTGLGITLDGTDAALFSVTTNPVAPLIPGSTTTFTVRFAPASTGPKTAALHIGSNDTNNNPFNIAITGTGVDGGIVVSTNGFITTASSITLNPQTGLFEQTVRLTNSSPATIAGLRLLILSLPVDVQVYNASGNTNGIPFVQYGLPLAAGATVDLLIEYYRANRQSIPQPVFVVQVIAPVAVTETGPTMTVDRSVQLTSGRFLIEFSAIPGRSYAVQYSSDMVNWTTANPIIIAPANRVQWYDDGPPKTDSKPSTSGSRFYQVMLLP